MTIPLYHSMAVPHDRLHCNDVLEFKVNYNMLHFICVSLQFRLGLQGKFVVQFCHLLGYAWVCKSADSALAPPTIGSAVGLHPGCALGSHLPLSSPLWLLPLPRLSRMPILCPYPKPCPLLLHFFWGGGWRGSNVTFLSCSALSTLKVPIYLKRNLNLM